MSSKVILCRHVRSKAGARGEFPKTAGSQGAGSPDAPANRTVVDTQSTVRHCSIMMDCSAANCSHGWACYATGTRGMPVGATTQDYGAHNRQPPKQLPCQSSHSQHTGALRCEETAQVTHGFCCRPMYIVNLLSVGCTYNAHSKDSADTDGNEWYLSLK